MTFRMIFFALALALVTWVLGACSNGEDKDSSGTGMAMDQPTVLDDHANDHSHGDTATSGKDEFKKPEGLYLNRGEKWEVNG